MEYNNVYNYYDFNIYNSIKAIFSIYKVSNCTGIIDDYVIDKLTMFYIF